MTHLVQGATLTDAWVVALDHLVARGGEEFGLIVEMIDPAPSHVGPAIIQHVDELLARKDHDPVATVTNAIFPAGLAASSPDRPTLYTGAIRPYYCAFAVSRATRRVCTSSA